MKKICCLFRLSMSNLANPLLILWAMLGKHLYFYAQKYSEAVREELKILLLEDVGDKNLFWQSG